MTDTEGPGVSVVIPTHNRAHLLPRALESVVRQSYSGWECIVVDDGSTDGTETLMAELEDPRIRYLRHPVNQGGSAARNTGVAAARGEWIAFLDSDDEWLPQKLEKQLACIRSTELADLALVYTGFTTVRGDRETGPSLPVHRGRVYAELLRSNVVGSTSLALVRRDALLSVGGFDASLPAKQDVDLWIRLAREHHVDFVPEALVRMHQGEGERRITTDGDGRVVARERFFRKHEAELRAHGLIPAYHCRTGQIYLRHVRDPGGARRWYREALRERPTALLAWAMLGVTLVPLAVQDWLARRVRRPDRGSD